MKRLLISLLILSFVVLIFAQESPQPVPESYIGYAMLDGEVASSGLPVTVKVTGTYETVGSTTTEDSGAFSLDVIFDNPDTAGDEGADEGDSLIWYVSGNTCTSPAAGSDTADSGEHNSNFVIQAETAGECTCNGDESPCDSTVDDFELLHYIIAWSEEEVEDFDLLYAINYWAGAWTCP